MSPRTLSLPERLAAAVAFSIATVTTVAVGVTLTDHPTPDSDQVVTATPSRGTADQLIRGHHCWTLLQGPPADMVGKFPGHVVTYVPGAADPTYSARLVGAALEQVAHDNPQLGWSHAVDHGLTVRGFCR